MGLRWQAAFHAEGVTDSSRWSADHRITVHIIPPAEGVQEFSHPSRVRDYRLVIRWSSQRSGPPATFSQTLRVAIPQNGTTESQVLRNVCNLRIALHSIHSKFADAIHSCRLSQMKFQYPDSAASRLHPLHPRPILERRIPTTTSLRRQVHHIPNRNQLINARRRSTNPHETEKTNFPTGAFSGRKS